MSKFKEDIEKIGRRFFQFGNANAMGVRVSNDDWGYTSDKLLTIAREMDKYIDKLENPDSATSSDTS